MILVDTSIWIDHLRAGDAVLAGLLRAGRAWTHPFVIGEIALGGLRDRALILHDLSMLPKVTVATDQEVLRLIETQSLFGLGVGYVDAHLLAAVRLTPGARLWTRDRRLGEASERLSLSQ